MEKARKREREQEGVRTLRVYCTVLFNPVGYFRRDLTLVSALLSLINNKTPRQKCVVNYALRQQAKNSSRILVPPLPEQFQNSSPPFYFL